MIADRVLIVDDEEKIRKIFSRLLTDEGYRVKAVDSGTSALKVFPVFKPHLVLLDQNMPGLNGIETLMRIREQYPETVVIIITAYGAVSLAVEAIKKGAYDYLEKPVDNDKMLLLLQRAADHHRMNAELKRLRHKLNAPFSFDHIVAASYEMKQVIEQARCVCETDATVMITGESGVGKEVIASAIHHNSNRGKKQMIAVNCGAIPMTLIESELFGHEKGAFTDARWTKPGKFEQANESTLFLDEIAELPSDAQVKLLRVLEEKKLTRLGGKAAIPVDVRIISATNKNLEEKVQQGSFRLDLLYRLNIFTISIPPLRERKEDIPLLAELFLRNYNDQLKLKVNNITESAMKQLCSYTWPGNVRDLQNALQSAMLIARSGSITIGHLPLRIKGYDHSDDVDMHSGLDANIRRQNEKTEIGLIREALRSCSYNRTETARRLRISRKTLFNKMKKYRLG